MLLITLKWLCMFYLWVDFIRMPGEAWGYSVILSIHFYWVPSSDGYCPQTIFYLHNCPLKSACYLHFIGESSWKSQVRGRTSIWTQVCDAPSQHAKPPHDTPKPDRTYTEWWRLKLLSDSFCLQEPHTHWYINLIRTTSALWNSKLQGCGLGKNWSLHGGKGAEAVIRESLTDEGFDLGLELYVVKDSQGSKDGLLRIVWTVVWLCAVSKECD